jgi:hypothetical protein
VIELSHSGRKVAEELAHAQEVRVRRILEELPRRQQQRLIYAMAIIEEILERDPIANLLEIHNDG